MPVKVALAEVNPKRWWERPPGIIALGILVTVIGGLILWAVTRHYDKPTPSPVVAQPTVQPKPQAAQPEAKAQRNTPPESTSQQGVTKKKIKIEQHGDSSGAVGGSITQGPCSNLQIGGSHNQATTNCLPPQRTISQADRKTLIDVLSRNRGKVGVGSLGIDPESETLKFAQQLFDIFDSSGWNVYPRAIIPMVNPKAPSGVQIVCKGESIYPGPSGGNRIPSIALLVRQSLNDAQVKSVTFTEVTDPKHPADYLLLVVGRNPDKYAESVR